MRREYKGKGGEGKVATGKTSKETKEGETKAKGCLAKVRSGKES
jgi:hypothetical protein